MKLDILKHKKYFVLDMDGTFYLGDKLIEGSIDFIHNIEKTGKNFVFYTNNSSKSSSDYTRKLSKMGFSTAQNKIITSGMVTTHYLKQSYNNPKIFLLGTEELENEFLTSGLSLVSDNPDIVVVGFDTTITYDKLSKACDFIRNGKMFLATHPDFNCPTETGFIPDCGAICAFITASTGQLPKFLGKPYIETVNYVLDYFKCNKDDLVFIGDRLYTDIAIAVNNSITGVLVLSGETKETDLVHTYYKPDIVVNRLADLI